MNTLTENMQMKKTIIPQHNFQIANTDTDSISFCKQTGESFSKEELNSLISELNDISPEYMLWENDGYYEKVIILRAKNYILYDGKKIIIKGSGLKSSTIEPILKQMLNEFIDGLIFDKNNLLDIYHKYVKMVSNIEDIKPWSKKMTLSATTYKSERKNETNIIDAIAFTEYREGDRVYLFPKSDGTLCLAERFEKDYDKDKYYEKIFKTALRFNSVMDMSQFTNFKLKRSKVKLLEIIS